MNIALWLSANAFWIVLIIIGFYLAYKGLMAYLDNENKIRDFFKRFKKRENENNK